MSDKSDRYNTNFIEAKRKMKNEKHFFELLLISILLIWVVFIFFQYVTNHSDYVLFFSIFDTVFGDIIFLLFVAFLAFCLGSTLIKFAFKIQLDYDCSFLFSSALGFIILSLGMEILTFSQILSKLSVVLFLIILILVSSKEIIYTIKKIKIPLFKLISNYDYIFLFFLLIFILINFLFALTPPVGHDEQQYHLTAPLRYIQNGGFYVIKNIGSQVNYPQNTEMLYALALILKGDISAKLINFYFGILILLLIQSITKRFFNLSGILPTAIFYCSWLTYYISTRANVELAQTFFVGISLYSILIWLENRVGTSPTPTISPNSECNKERIYSFPTFYFYFSAIAAGFSLGIKYNSLFSILALFLVLIYYYLFILKEKLKLLILSLSKYLIIILLLFSPWVIKNIIYFKNPFEPFKVNKIFSVATGLFTKNIQPETKDSYLTERAHILYRISYPEYSLKELSLVPYNATIYGEWGRQVFDSLISPFYLMFLPFIIFIIRKNRIVIALLIYILINYLLWLFIQPLTRYLTPFMPFMAILSAYVIYQLTVVENECMRSLLKYFGHIFKILVITSIFIMMCTQILIFIKKNPVNYLFGLESRYKYLERNNAVGIQPFIEYINRELPESTKVYLLWEKRGYYLNRDYKEDTYGNILARLVSQYNEPSKVMGELKKMGFTHILCDTNIPRFWFGSSYKNKINQQARELGNREFEFFEKMAQENLTLLMKNSVLRLYEIN